MNQNLDKKIAVLIAKANETKANKQKSPAISSNLQNSLAEKIKTREQAKSFMTLINAL